MKNTTKALAIGLLTSPFAVLAQESGNASIDISAAEGLASSLGSTLSTFVTSSVMPAVLGIIGAVASLLLLYRVVRWFMRALGGR